MMIDETDGIFTVQMNYGEFTALQAGITVALILNQTRENPKLANILFRMLEEITQFKDKKGII